MLLPLALEWKLDPGFLSLVTVCLSLTARTVCGDWSAVDGRGPHPGAAGAGRRRAQWLRLHRKVSDQPRKTLAFVQSLDQSIVAVLCSESTTNRSTPRAKERALVRIISAQKRAICATARKSALTTFNAHMRYSRMGRANK